MAEPQEKNIHARPASEHASPSGHAPMQGGNQPLPPLAIELSGSLPCFRCQYDLRGMSITSACPECGMPVRATLVQVIDPTALEISPLRNPRAASWGVLLWASGGAVCAACVLVAHVFAWSGKSQFVFDRSIAWAVLLTAFVSMLGSTLTWKPLASDRWSFRTLLPVLATATYIPLIAALYTLVVQRAGWSYIKGPWLESRLSLAACVVLILLCMRPTVRLLAARGWMLARSHKDRQTTFSLAIVVLTGAVVLVLVASSPLVQEPQLRIMVSYIVVILSLLLLCLGLARLSTELWNLRRRIETGFAPVKRVIPRPTANSPSHSSLPSHQTQP